MQFIDLKTQYQRLKSDIDARIHKVLDHGQYIMGPEIGELESKLANFVGVKHAISCSNGTDALLMPLMAYGIKPGDAIFTTPFTFVATAEVISLLGATPIFVDIDPETFNIDPLALERTVEEVLVEGQFRPRGIIPVDLFGLPAAYDEIQEVADKHHLFLLEDAAQALGGIYKGRQAGSFGNVAATSFFPAKPLGCYGDGGAVFTNDDHLAELIRSIRIHGQGVDKYHNIRIGLNGRLDSIQAAVLIPKLEIFPEELEARDRVASWYNAKLEGVQTPFVPEHARSAWAQYSVLSSKRDAIMEALRVEGIPTAIYYKNPLHLLEAFDKIGYAKGDFPVSEAMSEQIFSLPMHPYLSEAEVERIAAIINHAAIHA